LEFGWEMKVLSVAKNIIQLKFQLTPFQYE